MKAALFGLVLLWTLGTPAGAFGFADTGMGEVLEREEPMDGPGLTVACVGNACLGTGAGCAGSRYAFGGSCEARQECRSDWWNAQTWTVEGEHRGGGRVEFYAQCGPDIVSVCRTIELPQCQDETPGSGDGRLGCFYRVISGDPEGILGKCVDPVDPALAYEAVPEGTPFIAAERLLPPA